MDDKIKTTKTNLPSLEPAQTKTGPQVGAFDTTQPNKRFSMRIIILAIGITLAGCVLLGRQSLSNLFLGDQHCSDQLLQQASADLYPVNVPELRKVTMKIESLRGYDHDPNCLYVTTTFYINTSNVAAARRNLDMLQGVYSAQKGLSHYVSGPTIPTIANLKQQVDFLKLASEQPTNARRR